MIEVKLITSTERPINTVWKIWMESKTNGEYPNISSSEKLELFQKLLIMDVPIMESIYFTFLIKGISISWREQAVRHRIGTKVGDRTGVDIIPEYNMSSFWSQSFRIKDMSEFYENKEFRIPESINENKEALSFYRHTMSEIQYAYSTLVTKYGIPYEDARELLPLGTTSNITWTLNLKALKHITRKRSCYILQSSLWHPVISGMVAQIDSKVSQQIADTLREPPCVECGKYKDCVYKTENDRRIKGEDSLPVCPMFLYHSVINKSPTSINPKSDNNPELINELIESALNHTVIEEADVPAFIIKMKEDLNRFSKYWKHLIYPKSMEV